MTYGFTLFLTKYGTLAREREKETATRAGLATRGKDAPCVTCSSVGERGAWVQTDGMTTRGDAVARHAIAVRLAMGRLIAPMDADCVKAHGAPTAGTHHVIAAMTPQVKARVMGDARSKAEMIGATPADAAVAMVAVAVPVALAEQAPRAVVRAPRVRTTKTTTARAGGGPRPPTARCARAPRLAKTPGTRPSNVDGVPLGRAVARVDSGKTTRGLDGSAQVAATQADVCPVATTHVTPARDGQGRLRLRRNLAASRLAHRSALSC